MPKAFFAAQFYPLRHLDFKYSCLSEHKKMPGFSDSSNFMNISCDSHGFVKN